MKPSFKEASGFTLFATHDLHVQYVYKRHSKGGKEVLIKSTLSVFLHILRPCFMLQLVLQKSWKDTKETCHGIRQMGQGSFIRLDRRL